jgi:hypothetical protein
MGTFPRSVLFSDWRLLHQIDEDLRILSEFHRVDLPFHLQHVERARRVEIIMQKTKRHPASWWELAERLYVDPWLSWFVQRQGAYRQALDGPARESILNDVRAKLYVVIIRNAGNYHRRGDHTANWQGFVIRQVPTLAKRAARVANPHVRERPNGGDVEFISQSSKFSAAWFERSSASFVHGKLRDSKHLSTEKVRLDATGQIAHRVARCFRESHTELQPVRPNHYQND